MTPLEEAVARIIRSQAVCLLVPDHNDDERIAEVTGPIDDLAAKSLKDAFLALPEIVKMQEALKIFSRLHDDVLCGRDYVPDDAALVLTTLDGGIVDTSNRIEAGDLRRAREALAAIQPLKKEAE